MWVNASGALFTNRSRIAFAAYNGANISHGQLAKVI
jgi:hypothetical protein